MPILSLFLSLDGRIGRLQYFLGWLVLLIAAFVIAFSALPPLRSEDFLSPSAFANRTPSIGFLFALPFYYFHFAVAIKRAHDFGRSGWWLVAWMLASTAALILEHRTFNRMHTSSL